MQNLTDKELNEFKATTNRIWNYKLLNAFNEITRVLLCSHSIIVEAPNFRIDNLGQKWGEWDEGKRLISLHENLFRFYPWAAVLHVLRHEMAHLIVSEIFKIHDALPHGIHWEKACELLKVDPKVTVSYTYLNDYHSHTYDKMALRIQKLMALGESSFKAEAESALNKAYELMERHKVIVARKSDNHKIFTHRPLGILFKKVPSYAWSVARILSGYYNVKCIQMNYYGEHTSGKYLEIFGEPHHLDVAEYVYYFILFEAERQWYEFKESDEWTHDHGKIQWIKDFIRGFASNLSVHKEKVEKRMDDDTHSLILRYTEILGEKYDEAYPRHINLFTHTTNRKSGDGGYEAGKRTTLRSAIRQNSSVSCGLLTA